jgi:UDP-N-acetyl-D-mannosaminuronic acid dehydrogenase
LESTISPGTVDKHIRPLIPEGVEIVHAPERIIPGNMINEIKNNARIIGADNVEVGNRIKMIYKTFCDGEISITDIKTAEMIKVAENTYRDINIAYANELTKICESAGLDVYRVIALANKHPRVNILTPGPGVGGHCISVDPWFLVGDYPGLANLILTARKINDSMPEYVLKRIADIMDENNIANLDEIGLYGLTYKENVDDIRESPTLQLLQCMRDHLAKGIKVYDPMIKKRVVDCQVMSFDDFLDASSMIVIMVGHEEIIRCSNRLRGKIVLDTRNVINGNGIYRL